MQQSLPWNSRAILSFPHFYLLLALFCLASGGTLRAAGDSVLIFNEIQYHPLNPATQTEWVELRSLQAVDVDIGGWRIEGGIDYTFPNGTVMPGLGHIVVAAAPGQIPGAYGPFTGQLDNGGETIRLVNRNGRVMDELTYDDEGDWPLGADGSGATLTRRNPSAASGAGEWTTSKNIGGTPGAKNYAEPSDPPVVTTLIPLNATWKYRDDNVAQPAGWNGQAFDDASWASGGALLYAGSPNISGAGEGIHGYWPLEETTGTTAPNLASGGTTGSLVNGPTWVTDGTRGKVLSFDGVDDYVNAGFLPQMTLSNNFTWSFWTFSSQIGGNVILGNRYSPSGADWSPREFIKFTSDAFQYDTNSVLFVNYADIPTGTWVHHAMVKQGSLLTYYRNGVATNSASISAGQNNAQPFYFGGDKGGERWAGRLDDIAVWTKALPASSIASLANGTVTPLTAPTGSSGSALTTQVAQGPTTHYFRKSFTFSGAKERTTLTLQHMLDDGAVVYLNGTEVLRANMGGGAVTHTTPASSDITSTGLSASLPVSTDSLVNGTNVLAVEVHQHPNNSDMVFGVSLVASEAPDVASNPATLVFSEISGASDPGFFIELQNQSSSPVNSSGWTLTTSNGDAFPVPAQTINGGGFLSFTAASIGLTPVDGMRLYLFAPGGTNLRDARAITNRIRGLGSDGRWAHPTASTPGAANVVTVSTDIVINEIFYHGLNGSPEQWIELHNRSGAPVDVGGWKLTDGVSFDIPPSTTIAAGGFLVIAWDPAAFASLHPSVTALGPWSGSLSNGGEQITLRDANDNVTDQLTYADGGRWPSWADGGGSSLELRDPRADNSKGEAWDASDESSKSSWVTIASGTYQGLGANSNASDPANYNEFVFGLLDAGEFLIDDISVKDVSLGNAELIQNGSFEGGTAAAWRIIGTHSGTVINDPTSGSGKVLKVAATGATEHMHNHAETTLKVGSSYVTLDATHTYNITFRAKWLRGSNRLHTRLWHNRLPRQTLLNVPSTGGTPGAPNGKAAPNIGPTFDALAVAPVVPAAAQPATVTIRVADPDNVTNVQLFTSVNGAGFTSTAMSSLGNGVYSGPVGAQSAGALVQFYVQATDGLGATTFFPPAGPASRAMIPWADARAQLTLASGARPHNIRVVLPTADATELYKPENLMSDQAVPCTVILDEATAFYRAGVRLKSSEHGRIAENRCGYTLEFPSDDLFFGIHDTVAVDRSGGVVTGQKEILLKRLENTAGGIYAPEDDICRVISAVGTFPPGQFTGSGITGAAILSKTRMDKEYLDNQFPNGGDGSMHKYERVYVLTETINPTTRAIGVPAAGTAAVEYMKVPQASTSPPGVNVVSLGSNKEAYRWYWLLQNNREADDFSGIINVTNAVGQAGGSASFNSLVAQHVNVETWLRACIPATLYGVTDNYLGAGGNGQHNTLIYFPPGQKAVLMPWDLDFLDQSNTSASLTARGDVDKFIANPVWKRLFYGHLQDILSRSFNSSYMTTWAQHYSRFGTDDMTSQVGTYLVPRANFAASQITAQIPSVAFARTSASPVTVSTPFTTVTGNGWINIAQIRLQGSNEPLNVTWTGQTTWSLQLPVNAGTNTYTLNAYDYSGAFISSVSVTVTGSGGVFPAGPGNLVVSELHYNPPGNGDATEFIELLNVTNSTLDLTGCHFDEENGQGIAFAFANSTQVAAGARIIVTKNRSAFLAAYPSATAQTAAGQYDPSSLDNNGESVVLYAASGFEIFRFTYSDSPQSTDGDGRSLVRILSTTAPSGTTYEWRASTVDGGNPGTTDALPFAGTPLGDGDQDGIQALLEYAFGTDDSVNTSPLPWTFTRDALGRYLFIFRHVPNADDAALKIEGATAPGGPWGNASATLLSTTPAGNAVIETWQLTPPVGATAFFARLKATQR